LTFFDSVYARARLKGNLELSRRINIVRLLFTTSELSGTLERLNYRGEIIDRVVDDPMLAVSAAVHVSAQKVRVSEAVLAKN
jgi:hypothetical protein